MVTVDQAVTHNHQEPRRHPMLRPECRWIPLMTLSSIKVDFSVSPLVSVATMSSSSKRTTSSQPSNTSDTSFTTSSRFSPSSAVDRFVALQRRKRPASPSPLVPASRQSSSESIQPPVTKRQRHGPTSHDRAQTPPPSSGDMQGRASTHSPGAKRDRVQGRVQEQTFVHGTARIHSSASYSSEASSPVVVRPYDTLPAPSQEIHRYITSTRVIQNTAIVRSLLDPECGRSQLVERDVEYLRVNTPILSLKTRATKQVSKKRMDHVN